MQAPNPSQRSMQRRSPGADPGPPPSSSGAPLPQRAMSPANMQPRTSTTSSKSGGSRRGNSNGSNMPLSQIEKSVTHLLVATKQLLETLTQWSRGQATDTQVSDVYVRLGYEFNMACRAFTAINVDTSDLGNVPESLRHILEATLSQEASTESLEKYLPRIRDIIINLLHGLKRKQQKLRQKQARDRESNGGSPDGAGIAARTMSSSTMGSANTGLTNLLNEGIENGYSQPDSAGPASSGPSGVNTSPSRRFPPRDQSHVSVNSEQSSLSSTTMQNMPVLPPYPGDESTVPSGPSAVSIDIDSFPPPPPPPKSQQSALAALQRGGDLERRASRRYSAYQISKHLGAPNSVPMLPSQNTPIPNRGRGEVRESMRAVQVRESLRHNRNQSNQSTRSKNAFDSSPARIPSKVSEEGSSTTELPPATPESPRAESPEDTYRPRATISGPLEDTFPIMGVLESPEKEKPTAPKFGTAPEAKLPQPPQTPPEKRHNDFVPEQSPTLGKELTLFLQYKSKVKKFVLAGGYSDLTIGRLQLAFIEKFSWNTALNGADLPEIYIQDPVSGIRHELEDLSDIKDRTVLALNIEPLDEVKRHIDDGLGALKKAVDEVKQNVGDHGEALQRVSDRQLETAKEMARLASAPPMIMESSGSKTSDPAGKVNPSQLREIHSLRRDLAVLRQTYSNFQTEIQSSMSTLRNKAANVKVAAVNASVPSVDGDSGYAYVKTGRKQLNSDSDRLVTKVDDLQDLIEDLRKDVVHRGVRPLPRQLETVSKDIQLLMKELRKMEDYMKREKPVWTKIWEKELEDVCQGRDELKVMEDLMVDLQDDLEKAGETFALVEQATKEQMKDNITPTARQFSKGLQNLGVGADPTVAKEGVLGEVRALQPNHEDRLEAIERAEKLRQKELESRTDNPLKKELSNFVEEGKLKKSGGFEEVERARKAKDDKIRREVWERMNGIVPEEPIGEDEVLEANGSEEVGAEAMAPAGAL
ncbi:actin interacting protein 3-domain-containing protein [Pseudomassariella vexata]|uniref:Actin interacting protein 3-domain-containing protein n=1 Tax=Pseudomassariella vexata TaxID=1141098 RepID=A0A1Y2E0D9_9PEZI|nr:actin interacting protein 3-domain-containing protein [Pseudomassariella vexata]ORY64335.1 actin interacting protein 3-domain-containing protein [Pseudomassariella vexata]